VEGGSPRREGEKVRISGKALAQVSAARQEYLDKIEAHTDCGKLVLNLDKMLEEKRVDLDEREQDLELCSTALAEAQARGLNPWDIHDELMEFVELRRLLQDIEVDRAIEASRLAALVRDVFQVLEILGMPSIPGKPRDLRMADDILGRWM
jgi:hypothetical protein